MTRTLYLIAYDITEDNRLHDVRYLLKGYSTDCRQISKRA